MAASAMASLPYQISRFMGRGAFQSFSMVMKEAGHIYAQLAQPMQAASSVQDAGW